MSKTMKTLSFALVVVAAAVPLAAACGPVKPPTNKGDPDFVAPPASAPVASSAPVSGEPAPSKDVDEGRRAFEAGDLPAAQTAFEAAAAANANNYYAFYGLGMVHEKAARKPNAIEAYKKALALKPDYEDAAIRLSALYLDANRVEDAILVCRPVLARKPANATLHNTLAIALAMQGFDREASLKEFEEALRLNGSEPMFHLSYAQWLNAWKMKGAAAHLDVARGFAKEDFGMLASIAHELRMAGEFQSCADLYTKLIAKKDGGEVRTERALCKLGLKDEAGVLADLQAALAKEPGYAPAHYYVAGRFAVQKKWKEAAAEYEKYLQLDPQGSLAKAATERLAAAKQMMGNKK